MGGVIDDVVNVATLGIVDDLSGAEAAKSEAKKAAERQAKGIREGSQISADAQREALEYMKEREALPTQFRDQALTGLAGLADMEGGTGSQQALIDRAMQSPLYGAIMGGQQAGEEAIMRNAAMTGGLRSGDVQSNFMDFNTELQNKALLESYNQQLSGLQGLANLPSNAGAIAGQMSGIGQTLGGGAAGVGQTLAQGRIGGAQAATAAQNQLFGDATQAASMAASMAFSDVRLKSDIKLTGNRGGHNWYSWTWNTKAADLGLSGDGEGVMAHEVYTTNPELIGQSEGYITVNYAGIK